jgi:hypothetical protein
LLLAFVYSSRHQAGIRRKNKRANKRGLKGDAANYF